MTDTHEQESAESKNQSKNQPKSQPKNQPLQDADSSATGDIQTASQDSRNLALLGWIGAIFLGFIPGLILYLVKQDDAFVSVHAKENLNFSITLLIAYIVSSVLMAVLIGFVLFFLVLVVNIVICIIAAMKASKGEMYQVPFILRLVK